MSEVGHFGWRFDEELAQRVGRIGLSPITASIGLEELPSSGALVEVRLDPFMLNAAIRSYTGVRPEFHSQYAGGSAVQRASYLLGRSNLHILTYDGKVPVVQGPFGVSSVYSSVRETSDLTGEPDAQKAHYITRIVSPPEGVELFEAISEAAQLQEQSGLVGVSRVAADILYQGA